MPIRTKIENPPLCAKNPEAKSSESPGKKGKNTTPVSMKMMRKTKPYAVKGPAAIAVAIAERGSRSSEIIASINPMSSNRCRYTARLTDSEKAPRTQAFNAKSALSRHGCP